MLATTSLAFALVLRTPLIAPRQPSVARSSVRLQTPAYDASNAKSSVSKQPDVEEAVASVKTLIEEDIVGSWWSSATSVKTLKEDIVGSWWSSAYKQPPPQTKSALRAVVALPSRCLDLCASAFVRLFRTVDAFAHLAEHIAVALRQTPRLTPTQRISTAPTLRQTELRSSVPLQWRADSSQWKRGVPPRRLPGITGADFQ
jgi:hypothetical protein